MRKSKTVKVNLSDTVFVRLTEAGVVRHYEYYREMAHMMRRSIRSIKPPLKMDKEGWVEFTFWDLMQIFGTKMLIGNRLMFANGDMRISRK